MPTIMSCDCCSQSILTLNVLERMLCDPRAHGMVDANGATLHWQRDKNYFRLEGQTRATQRDQMVRKFNTDSNLLLFLISTR